MGVKTIDYRIRFLYAIGIYLVVAGHCRCGGISLFYDWFPMYAFHMGLFVFCSGYLFSDDAVKNVFGFITKKFKRLVIPLYLWNIFYALLVFILAYWGFSIGDKVTLENLTIAPIKTGTQFLYNLPGWFVIPLFIIEIFVAISRYIIYLFKNKINEIKFFVICLILGCIGTYLARIGYRTGWWLLLVRVLHLLPYFAFGILYKSKLEKHDNLSNTKYFGIVFLIQFIIILLHKGPFIVSVVSCDNFPSVPIEPYITGIAGIAFWGRIARLIEPLIKNNYLINLIATNTYIIMINHILGFMIIKTGYALVHKFTSLASGFDMIKYKSDYLYFYNPKNIFQMLIIYVIAGLAFPLLLKKIGEFIKRFFNKCLNAKNNSDRIPEKNML